MPNESEEQEVGVWFSGVREVIDAVNEGRGGPEPDLGKAGCLPSDCLQRCSHYNKENSFRPLQGTRVSQQCQYTGTPGSGEICTGKLRGCHFKE